MNNEDKILETLNTILTQMSSMDNRLDSIEEVQKETKSELQETKSELQETKSIILRMEQEHGKKLDALFDGYSVNYDKTTEVEKELTALKGRMDKVEFQIKYMMEPPKASSN